MEYPDQIECLYRMLKNEILREKDRDSMLLKMQDFIHFCWMNAPLRFGDPELDQIVRDNIPSWQYSAHHADENQFLHVASTLFEVGGHTRCLMNTISHFPEHNHTLVLTRQFKPIPAPVNDFFVRHNVKVLLIDTTKRIMDKVEALRQQIFTLNPVKVFSFHHPDDLTPVLALTGSKKFQSIFYNHADHVFSVGSCFFDKHIDFRKTGARVSHLGRNVKCSQVLPLPLTMESKPEETNEKKLKSEDYEFVVGTLTNKSKIKSYQQASTVVDVMIELAEENKKLLFVIIGIDQKTAQECSEKSLPQNLTCLGVVPNPDPYYRELDFFLEPFPVGSGLGIIEACQYGAIPIFSKHPAKLCSTFEVFHEEVQKLSDPNIVEMKQHKQLQYYMEKSQAEIFSIKEKFVMLIHEYHKGNGWKNQLLFGKNVEIENDKTDISETWIKEEALFFQTYMRKNNEELLTFLLSLKNIVGRRLLFFMMFSQGTRNLFYSVFSKNRGRFIHRLIFG